MNSNFQSWDALEDYVEKTVATGARSFLDLVCPDCASAVQVRTTESGKAAKIVCKTCRIETIACGIPYAKQ